MVKREASSKMINAYNPQKDKQGIPYSRFKTENLILRDFLAMDRTILANERTFLAYVRTALTLLIGGVGLRNLFADDLAMGILGSVSIIVSVPIFIVGLYRYIKKKNNIDKLINKS